MREAWTVAVGNLPLLWRFRKAVKKAIKTIEEQEGFIGLHPTYPRGTILLFDSENNAKGARNMLRYYGITCGDNICKVYVEEKDYRWLKY